MDLLNQAQRGEKALELQGQFKNVATKAHRRAEIVEAAFEHLREVLAKVEADLTIVKVNLDEVKDDLALKRKRDREIEVARAKEELAKVKKEVKTTMKKY